MNSSTTYIEGLLGTKRVLKSCFVTFSLLVQILVVVANIQMRALKTEVGKVPCEQQLDMG